MHARWVVLCLVAACADPVDVESSSSALARGRLVQGTVLHTNTAYRIEAGSTVYFTTPPSPGYYTWADLLREKVPGLRMSEDVLVVSPRALGHSCDPPISGDASDLLQTCIAATPEGTALELGPGRYLVSRPIRIDRAITIRTRGVREDAARCGRNAIACAEIAASASLAEPGGFLTSLNPTTGLVIDHVTVDGNRAARLATASADRCRASENQYGVNADLRSCTGCRVTNSLFVNALCGTGLHVWDVDVVSSLFADNGSHTNDSLWADGLTVGRCDGSRTLNNDFRDNTDVDLIFGSGYGCVGRGNRIVHGGDPAKGAFVAMSIFTWYTTGPYFGADFAFNDIACNGQCGIGLGLGSDGAMGPHFTFIEGGSVHDNRVSGAHQGISVDTARGVEFYDNVVTDSGGLHTTSCGTWELSAYDASRLSELDRSRDTVTTPFWHREWDWCTPNWFGSSPATMHDAGDFDGDGGYDLLEIFPPDTGWYVSKEPRIWLEGWGGGNMNIVGDYDGNGVDDVLLYLVPGRVWHVALSTASGFATHAFALSSTPLSLDTCSLDVDLDGDDDVVNGGRCMSYDATTHRFTVSSCPFTCDVPFNPNARPATTSALLYGSFDRDAISDRRDALSIDQAGLRWTVTPGRAPWLHRYDDWHAVLAGDYDGDGDGDVVIVDEIRGRWDLARSTGDRFLVTESVLTGFGPYGHMCTRDVDDDGRMDVLWHSSPTNLRAEYDPATGRFVVSPITYACAIP
jgi:hypothetical protein